MSFRARVIAAFFAISLGAALVSGRQLFYNLTYVWAGLIAVSFLWSQATAAGLIFSRERTSIRAQVGQVFREHFKLQNRSRWGKLWVEVYDHTDIPGYRANALTGLGLVGPSDFVGHRGSEVIEGLEPGHAFDWEARTVCIRRGRFLLGPVEIRTSDPFGLFPHTTRLRESGHIVVLPPVVRLQAYGVPAGRLSGGDAIRQRTHQLTPNASTVRDYAPGDSLNRIHWKSTARMQRLIAKEFEFDPLADIWVVLDGDRTAHHESLEPQAPFTGSFPSLDDPAAGLPRSTLEYSVTVAASLAYHFIRLDRNVGLICHSRARIVLPPGRGRPQMKKVLESLAVVAAGGHQSLAEVMKIEAGRIPRGTTVYMITASDDASALEAAVGLRALARNPHLIVIDAESFGGRRGCAGLAAEAQQRGIRTSLIRYGQSLAEALTRV